MKSDFELRAEGKREKKREGETERKKDGDGKKMTPFFLFARAFEREGEKYRLLSGER